MCACEEVRSLVCWHWLGNPSQHGVPGGVSHGGTKSEGKEGAGEEERGRGSGGQAGGEKRPTQGEEETWKRAGLRLHTCCSTSSESV